MRNAFHGDHNICAALPLAMAVEICTSRGSCVLSVSNEICNAGSGGRPTPLRVFCRTHGTIKFRVQAFAIVHT